MHGCQGSPVWPEFRTCICLAVHETSPRYHVSSCPTSVSSISWESSWKQETSQSSPQGRKQTAQLYSTAYNNNSFHIPDVRVVLCMRIIIPSYAGNNPGVHGAQTPFIARVRRSCYPRTTYDTIRGHDLEIRPAYSRR